MRRHSSAPVHQGPRTRLERHVLRVCIVHCEHTHISVCDRHDQTACHPASRPSELLGRYKAILARRLASAPRTRRPTAPGRRSGLPARRTELAGHAGAPGAAPRGHRHLRALRLCAAVGRASAKSISWPWRPAASSSANAPRPSSRSTPASSARAGHDGDSVQAGQVLIELDATNANADQSSVQSSSRPPTPTCAAPWPCSTPCRSPPLPREGRVGPRGQRRPPPIGMARHHRPPGQARRRAAPPRSRGRHRARGHRQARRHAAPGHASARPT